MKQIWFHSVPFTLLLTLISSLFLFASTPAVVLAQQPTEVSPTGIYITVITEEPQINVRMGPSSTIYPIVGTLLTGSTVPALGRSQGGDWIQIQFSSAPGGKGWVYSPLVQVSSGALLVVEPPPTPVPPATSTIDPTLAAQFLVQPTSTRMPTFTPPPALTIPAFESAANDKDSVPVATIILAFVILGMIGFVLSLLRRN